jgi:hypothetical protein
VVVEEDDEVLVVTGSLPVYPGLAVAVEFPFGSMI